MTRVYDAANGCSFSGRKILFDTNIWIAIDGNDPRPHHVSYSDFFGRVMMSDNTLVTNDYVISEYFNRSCKIQYQIQYAHEQNPWSLYKKRRKNGDLKGYMDVVRDICQDILQDCVFESAVTDGCPVANHVAESALGQLDLSDIIIREHCCRRGYVLVSDDADYYGCNLDLVTSNPKVLRDAKRDGKLIF